MKKIKLNLVKENTIPGVEKMKKICPDVISKYKEMQQQPDFSVTNPEVIALQRKYNTCIKYYDSLKNADAIIDNPSSSSKEKERALTLKTTIEEKLDLQKLKVNSNVVYETFVDWFATGMQEFKVGAMDPAVNSGEKLKYPEENNCVSNYMSHVGQASIIAVYYVALKSVVSFSLHPRFRSGRGGFPPAFKFFADLVTNQKNRKRFPNISKEFEETDAVKKLITNLEKNAPKVSGKTPSFEDLKRSGSLEAFKNGNYNKNVKGPGIDLDTLRGAGVGTARMATKVAGWGTLLSFLSVIGIESAKAVRNFFVGEGEEFSNAAETIEDVSYAMMLMDIVPKYILLDQSYQAVSNPANTPKKNDLANPCGLIGPLLGAILIGIGRSRLSGRWMRGGFKHGFGSGSKQLGQIDIEKYYIKVARNIGQEFRRSTDKISDFLNAKRAEWAESLISAAGKTGKFYGAYYPNLPAEVMKAYSKWALEVLKKGDNIGSKADLENLITEAFIQASKNGNFKFPKGVSGEIKSSNDIPEEALEELGYFMKAYNDGVVEMTRAAEKVMLDSQVIKEGTTLATLTRRFQKVNQNILRGRDPGNVEIDDLTEFGTNEIKTGGGKTTEELLDMREMIRNRQLERASGQTKRYSAGKQDLEALKKSKPELFNRAGKLNAEGMKWLTEWNAQNLGKALPALSESAEEMVFTLKDAFRVGKETKGALPSLEKYLALINRKDKLKDELSSRVMKKFFPDEDMDELVILLREKSDGSRRIFEAGADEGAVIYDLLIKKFGGRKSFRLSDEQIGLVQKELSEMTDYVASQIKVPLIEKIKKTSVYKALSASEQQGLSRAFQATVSTATILTVGGSLWYYNTLTKKQLATGEYYFADEEVGPIGSVFQDFLNSGTGGAAAAQADEMRRKHKEKIKQSKKVDADKAETIARNSSIRKLILLPPIKIDKKSKKTVLETVLSNTKLKNAGFDARIKFWNTLIENPEKYKSNSQNSLWQTYQVAVSKDINWIIKNEPERFENFQSAALSQPEILKIFQFEYGSPVALKVALKEYVDNPPTNKQRRYESVDKMFSRKKAIEYSKDSGVIQNSTIVKERSQAHERSRQENNRNLKKVFDLVSNSPLEDTPGSSINYLNQIDEAVRTIRYIDKNSLTDEDKEKLRTIKEQARQKLGKYPRKLRRINDIIDSKLQDNNQPIKERKNMSIDELKKIVKETMSESTGQGYNPYPYHSHIGEEGEEAPDFEQDWKDFELSLVRDESRDTAIRLAKILVKDLELFGDVVDLVGKNQSVATEILKKLRNDEEKF